MIEITSRQNSALRHLARLGRERKYRRTTGEMLCEGEKMLAEALRSGVAPGVLLVRLYETDGKACEAVLRCGFPVAEAALADGLERPQAGEVRWEGSEVRVTLRPHQAVTLRLRAGK